MYNWNAKKGYCQDISAILDSISSSDLGNFKALRSAMKISDKARNMIEEVVKIQEELNEAMKPFRERMKGANDEEKKLIDEESIPVAQPFIDRLNVIRNEDVVVELSNEEHDLLKSNFMKIIAKNLRSAKYAYLIGESLGVEEGE